MVLSFSFFKKNTVPQPEEIKFVKHRICAFVYFIFLVEMLPDLMGKLFDFT